ncbi:uncharacterized protein LOC105166978 [Sesamum indicum]|uniref:Uncharacterized protein LOC105166978 n=1 Tax=Sesamum indicum TaxID=4182 RepID=A0A8M8UXP8_SESIN|nr:uncharacterized protein LOC105166978 [Sesamum indicum]
MDSESKLQNQSLGKPISNLKASVGEKRGIRKAEETSECSHKRAKMHDLESVSRCKVQAGVRRSNRLHLDVNSDSGALDLNVNADPVSLMVGVDAPACIKESNELLAPVKEEKNRVFDLDLNAEDVSSSINNDPFYPYKNCEHSKLRDDSECGSSSGPLEEKDSMRIWEGLKQNNYLSIPYGAVSMAVPKTRRRKKNNNDVMKKKIELAKKEQIDRFAKAAAPTGLLSGLNPGIINHVRNRKQVHSIIEALVKSERTENQRSGSKQGNQINGGAHELSGWGYALDMHSSGLNRSAPNHGDVLLERRQTGHDGLFAKSNYLKSEATRRNDHSYMKETRIFERMSSQCNIENKENDGLALKLSSSVTVASEGTSCLSNEESGNFTSVTSPSVKAANVASQWLELLNQDIRGRLAALRRSKKRVRAVVTTELPLLMSREFSSKLENNSYTTEASTLCHFDKSSIDAHAIRWSTLFEEMEKALSEEESHLESWLNQVKEMQLHCQRGLYRSSFNDPSQDTGPAGINNRLREGHNSEKDLSVRAAAASIYSTCNYLSKMENLLFC